MRHPRKLLGKHRTPKGVLVGPTHITRHFGDSRLAMPPTIIRSACEAMRTRFEIVVVGDDATHLNAAVEEAFSEIHACESRLSAFLAGSLVSRINHAAGDRPVSVDLETLGMLRLAHDVHTQSRGCFDLTVGPLMRAWGFRDGAGSLHHDCAWGMGHLQLDHDRSAAWLDSRGMEIDCGAIAKGHALDLAAARLDDSGVHCGLLHAGTSSVLALDAPEGREGWTVAIAAPPGSALGASVTLRRCALGVSAPHGRQIMRDGKARGHVLDPRTGKPCDGSLLAAAICPTAAAADAWSTALLVAGAEGMQFDAPDLLARLIVAAGSDVLCASTQGPVGRSWCELKLQEKSGS